MSQSKKNEQAKRKNEFTRREFNRLRETWNARWEAALGIWSRYVQLTSPRFCYSAAQEKREGLTGSFAMIRLNDHGVVISLRQVVEHGLEEFPLEIMAHEIGHHVYCPGDLVSHGRMLARIRRGLGEAAQHAGSIANLYSDLFINDRLQRVHQLNMDGVYRALNIKTDDGLWNFYMRIYEILWGLPKATLTAPGFDVPPEMEGDAQLGNRLIRSYASDQVSGAGRFAALCYPYLVQANNANASVGVFGPLLDADSMAAGSSALPDGLARMDPDEATSAIHPALEAAGELPDSGEELPGVSKSAGGQGGNFREPFEYGQILQAMGINLDSQDLAGRYYRERALPHLVRYPVRESPAATEALPEGLDVWEIGSPLSRIDWLETAVRSPVVIPGYTTVQRAYGETRDASEPGFEPIDLDLYVDCSGSMPNPTVSVSYLTLAGAIIALSALKVGAKVQATLWSGARQYQSTDGFVTDERDVLRILTGYLGGATAFPIHMLRETYGFAGGSGKSNRKTSARQSANAKAGDERRKHILVISDDGVTTMFAEDELGNSGWDVSARALESAGAGGSFVLRLWRPLADDPQLVRARDMGWDIHVVQDWPDLVRFAQAFSRKHYDYDDRQRRAASPGRSAG